MLSMMSNASKKAPRTRKDLSRCKCFISYRRSDTGTLAPELAKRLQKALGAGVVFFDQESIGTGTDFWEEIEEALARVRLVLVLIGEQWLNTKDDKGKKRLWRCDDKVRAEIAIALTAGHNVTVVPVLVDAAQMPKEAELPKLLRPLHFRNAAPPLRTGEEYFERDVVTLSAFIQSALRPKRSFKFDATYNEPLLGRDYEVQQLGDWLTQEDLKLIVIVGAPGLGKTHLACVLGNSRDVVAHFDQRVFVDLRNHETVERMCEEVAQQLDVRTDGKANTRQLIGESLAAQTGRLLVVLDNLEQLAESAEPIVQEWSNMSGGVTFLATSRVHLAGVWREKILKALDEPPVNATSAELENNSAVRLFIKRSAFRQPSFQPQRDAGLVDVAVLCRNLDCNPLAILLVADLIVHRSVKALIQDLAIALEAADGAQGKLFSVIERSLNLLSEEAREIFIQAQIFEDGFSHEAALAVLGTQSAQDRGRDRKVVRALNELERHSLINCTESFVAGRIRVRYRMFRVVHELARRKRDEQRGKLAERNDKLLEKRWIGYFHAFAAEWNNSIHGPGGSEALEMLTIERENIVATIENALGCKDVNGVETLLSYAESLAIRGPAEIRGRLLNAALADRSLQKASRLALLGHRIHHCWAINQYADAHEDMVEVSEGYQDLRNCIEFGYANLAIARLEYHQSGGVKAKPIYQECAEMFSRLGDKRGVARSERGIASIIDTEGLYDESIRLLDKAISYFNSKQDLLELAVTINQRGLAKWHCGDYDSSLADFSESERLFAALGNEMRLAGVLTNRGLALTDAERFDEALMCFQQAEPLHIQARNRAWHAVNLGSKGRALHYKGDNKMAVAVLEDALALSRQGGYKENIALCTLNLARALVAQGKLHEGLQYFLETRKLQDDLYPKGNRRVCRTMIALAHLYAALEDVSSAREMTKTAIHMSARMGISHDDPRPIMRKDFAELLALQKSLRI